MMKEKQLKDLTAAAVIVIVLLQLTWMLHTYALQRRDIKVEVDRVFFEAGEIELYLRVDCITENTVDDDTLQMDYNFGAGQKISDFIMFQEFTFHYNSEISFCNLDSIFSELLKQRGLSLQISTYLVEKDSLQADILHQENNPVFGSIKTDLIPIRKDGTQYIQATVTNPYKAILARIVLLLLTTIVMLVFVAYCITLQIRIVVRQNRIAQLRNDFSNAMIHDMKTPLTSILVGTQVLEGGTLDKNPEMKKNYFRIMKDEVQHLLDLVNKVLTIAKMESQEVALERKVIAIESIVVDLIDKFSVKAAKEIQFITHFTKGSVYADEEYLKEAISNLIDNAIKYSGKSVKIEIACEEIDDCDRISVRDNGFGISLKDQGLIFEKFERGKAARRSSKGGATGFGLGLNYVQQVVQAHGGTVEIESIEGEYSVFTINLPKLMGELT